jgi:hypothetical protein
LAQTDIQSATPDYKVIVVRPVVVSVQSIASIIAQSVGSPLLNFKSIGISDYKSFSSSNPSSQEEVRALVERHFTGAIDLVTQANRNAKSCRSAWVPTNRQAGNR